MATNVIRVCLNVLTLFDLTVKDTRAYSMLKSSNLKMQFDENNCLKYLLFGTWGYNLVEHWGCVCDERSVALRLIVVSVLDGTILDLASMSSRFSMRFTAGLLCISMTSWPVDSWSATADTLCGFSGVGVSERSEGWCGRGECSGVDVLLVGLSAMSVFTGLTEKGSVSGVPRGSLRWVSEILLCWVSAS